MVGKKIWFMFGLFIKYNIIICMDAVPFTIKEHIENALSIGNIDEAKKVTQFHAFENVQQYRLPFRMFTVLEYVRYLTSISLPAKTASHILAYNGVNYIVDTSGVRLLQNWIAGFTDFTSNYDNIMLFIQHSSAWQLNESNFNKRQDTALHSVLNAYNRHKSSIDNPLWGPAIKEQIMNIATELLKNGANPDEKNKLGETFRESEFFAEHQEIFTQCVKAYEERVEKENLYKAIYEAASKGEYAKVEKLTGYKNFIKKSERVYFDLEGYLMHLEASKLPIDIWYDFLMYDSPNSRVCEEGTFLIHYLISKFTSLSPEEFDAYLRYIRNLIRNSKLLFINMLSDNSEPRTPLQEVLYVLTARASENSGLLKPYLTLIAEELLKHGADSTVVDNEGIAFNQTVFYQENKENFEECEHIYRLKLQITSPQDMREVTNFDSFITDEDTLDYEEYLRVLDKFNFPYSVILDYIKQRPINYRYLSGVRHLHSLVRELVDEEFSLADWEHFLEYVDSFSVQELDKTEEKTGTLLNFIVNALEALQPQLLVQVKLKQLIKVLIRKGVGLNKLSSTNKKFLRERGEEFELTALFQDSGSGDTSSDSVIKTQNDTYETKGSPPRKDKHLQRNVKPKTFLEKYGRQITFLSLVGMGIGCIAYRIYGTTSNTLPKMQTTHVGI